MAHRFTIGVEEEFQIVDPNTWELRSHVQELLASGSRSLGDQMKREMHQSIVEVGTNICEDVDPAPARDAEDPVGAVRGGRSGRPGGGGGRHASVLVVDRPGDLAGRALREHRRGAAAAGALAADLRAARPRRHAGQGRDDRHHERRALFPAAPAGALDQLAVLDGPRHRPEVVPHDDLPALPADGRARSLRLVERVRELPQPADRPPLHRRRQEDLVGHPAASDVRHAGVPRVRRADARRGHDRDCRGGAGHHREALQALHEEHGVPPLPARADRREQVARGALGPRRQPDRLRQEVRGADARPGHRADRVRGRRGGRTGQPRSTWTT